MITKSIELNIKDIDLSKREAVIAHATYKSPDSDGDKSLRGMFDKSWRENFGLLRFFLNHKKDQAPGKPLQTWDDSEHAYTKAKLGTHTLGDDVLKMLDEGVIVAASFGFEPLKYKANKSGGKDFVEVKHYETSVLTHWGAHEQSGVVSVEKAVSKFPKLNLKSLSQTEQDLLTLLIGNGMTSIQAAIDVAVQLDPDSDLYTFIMWWISRTADGIGNLRAELRYGMKEKIEAQIIKMQKFIRNTTASDEAIQLIQKSLSSLTNKYSLATSTETSIQQCRKCKTYGAVIVDESGCTKCTECNHIIKSQPDADRNGELRRKLIALKAKMAFSD